MTFKGRELLYSKGTATRKKMNRLEQKKIISSLGKILCGLGLSLQLTACAYHWGGTKRSLPGGYRQVAIPMFKNHSMETGAEIYFTNSLIQEFVRTPTARVVDTDRAEAVILGQIEQIKINADKTSLTKSETSNSLAENTVLAPTYKSYYEVTLRFVRKKDQVVLWQDKFIVAGSFTSPVVTSPWISTVNPIYLQSMRNNHVAEISSRLMSEAYDRLTENF